MRLDEYLDQSLRKLLDYRSATGYATETYRVTLQPFVDFCKTNFSERGEITKDMVDRWLEYKSYSTNSQISFIACLRNFSRYINFLGQRAYIPDEDYTLRMVVYEPYLPSDYEMEVLFDAIDSLKPTKRHGVVYHNDIVAPPLFRMMYCCGMRPSEPLHLKKDDVNLETGDIYIRETKQHKDRHIVMSQDMLDLCRKYDQLSKKDRTWFFDKNNTKFNTKWMTKLFQRTWKQSGLDRNGKIPRPYDLRHLFATKNIIRWMDEKKDINNLIPYLSTYLGHASLESTFYYIHLIPERLRNSNRISLECFFNYSDNGEVDHED